MNIVLAEQSCKVLSNINYQDNENAIKLEKSGLKVRGEELAEKGKH